jgi:hypothetical protein
LGRFRVLNGENMTLRKIWEIVSFPEFRPMLLMLSAPLAGLLIVGIVESLLARKGIKIFDVSERKKSELVGLMILGFNFFIIFMQMNKLYLAWGSFVVFGILFIRIYRSK